MWRFGMWWDSARLFGSPEITAISRGRGVVKIAQRYTSYGNMILVDHGLGLATLYLHLSKMNVAVGDVVERGQIIGLSGDTGYVAGPHLHVSVKIGGISIDPLKFSRSR